MNIKEAKNQIKNAMIAYFTKDEFGNYCIPLNKQRPVCLIGPPGIGKTAIMEQIAAELGVGLVSYSMTHHTRQSALGLPVIVEKEFEGDSYEVSEYTMSEIIGAIYEMMRVTGIREGILFLDEINCVSETLAPCMLQFLQYKIFGQHQVPAGWIVVTAGNPPEYNKSVRHFDIVTWDRLKRIDVEPDYEAFCEYSQKQGIHPAITSYLAARKKDFYKVESTVDGKQFVTARGWEDLSQMIILYEKNRLEVDVKLIIQYLQEPKIAREFSLYYELFNKYKSDYRIQQILDGLVEDTIVFRAEHAAFDERLMIVRILVNAIQQEIKKVNDEEDLLLRLKEELSMLQKKKGNFHELLKERIEKINEILFKGSRAQSLSSNEQKLTQTLLKRMEEIRRQIQNQNQFELSQVKMIFEQWVYEFREKGNLVRSQLENIFDFCERSFGEGNEMLVLVTELTSNYDCARFIGHFGCEGYYQHNETLQFYEREKEIESRIESLALNM